MSALASFVTGRRTKWVTLAIWVVLSLVLFPLGAKLADETQDDTQSFLPESAESTEVVKILDERVRLRRDDPGPDRLPARRRAHRGGQAEDRRRRQGSSRRSPRRTLPLVQPPTVPFAPGSPAALVSPDGDLAYTALIVPTNFEKQADWGENVRDVTGEDGDGMRILLTGDLGFSADSEEVFGELDTKLLLATVLLVLFLLGAIYRAVLVALTPLIVVFFAYTVAHGVRLPLRRSRARPSPRTATTILVVLMFGVGTDYCLLLVSRYREELRPHRGQARGDGARAAAAPARRSSPAA